MKIEQKEVFDLYHLLKTSYLAGTSHEQTTSLITKLFNQPEKQEPILQLFLDEKNNNWSLIKFTEEIYDILFPSNSLFGEIIQKYKNRIESLRNGNLSTPAFMDRARDEIKLFEEFIEVLQNLPKTIYRAYNEPAQLLHVITYQQEGNFTTETLPIAQNPTEFLIEQRMNGRKINILWSRPVTKEEFETLLKLFNVKVMKKLGLIVSYIGNDLVIPVKIFTTFAEGVLFLTELMEMPDVKTVELTSDQIEDEIKRSNLNVRKDSQYTMVRFEEFPSEMYDKLFNKNSVGELDNLILLEYVPGDIICTFNFES